MDKKHVGTYVVTAIYFLFSGIEYAIILPTLNLFLQSFDAPPIYLGLALSSFSFTGLISAPMYGRFTDRYDSTKAAVMLSNVFEIGGNIWYFMARSSWQIVLSRMVAGIGSGSSASIFGSVARTTTEEQRTAVFSLLLSLRQFGLLIGPACQIFLMKFEFYIGPFHVSSVNSPGLFMACLWTVHQILMAFFFRDIKTMDNEDDDVTTAHQDKNPDGTVRVSSWKEMALELLNENVIACLFSAFTVMFIQTGCEALMTPLTDMLFHWKEFQNSMVFIVIGAVVIVSFLVLGKISKTVSDRKMLVCGFVALNLLTISFIIFYNYLDQLSYTSKMVFFVIYTVGLVFDFPFIWVPQVSLFTKITSKENQAFYQGVRIFLMRIGMILGPLWASSTLYNYNIMLGLNLGMSLLLLGMVCLSYKTLVPPSSSTDDEQTPLLNGHRNVADA